eukprot:10199231-Karenia_brevis.AAC.1
MDHLAQQLTKKAESANLHEVAAAMRAFSSTVPVFVQVPPPPTEEEEERPREDDLTEVSS